VSFSTSQKADESKLEHPVLSGHPSVRGEGAFLESTSIDDTSIMFYHQSMRDEERVILEKIEKLKEEIRYLKKNKERFLKGLPHSVDIRKIVERSVYLCCEIVLDISDLLIVKSGLSKPLTYGDNL